MATRMFEGYNFFRPWVRERSLPALTALAGGGQSGATLCKAAISAFTTVATAGDSAILPGTQFNGSSGSRYTARGASLTVINLGAANMNLFPAVGESIDGLAANTAIQVQPNTVVYMTAYGPGVWVSSYAGFAGGTASVQKNVAAPVGTTSTTMVMMGIGALLTPVATGRVEVTICGTVGTNTTTDGAKYQISYGTGSAPVNGAALTGTQAGPNPVVTSLVTSALQVPFSVDVIVTGLTRGTQYWFDLALAAVTGGTANVAQTGTSVTEF